ncbi:hypothetical protein D3C87_2065150 [compost metagenome]
MPVEPEYRLPQCQVPVELGTYEVLGADRDCHYCDAADDLRHFPATGLDLVHGSDHRHHHQFR